MRLKESTRRFTQAQKAGGGRQSDEAVNRPSRRIRPVAPKLARARCVQLLVSCFGTPWKTLTKIVKRKPYCMKINLRSNWTNDSSPPSPGLLELEPMTLLESRKETQRKSVPIMHRLHMLKLGLNFSSNILDRFENSVLKNTIFVWSLENGTVSLDWKMWLYNIFAIRTKE